MVLEQFNLTTAQLFGIEYVIGIFIFTIIFNSLILWFLTKKFSFSKSKYEYALLVTFVAAFVSLFFEFSVPIWMEVWMLPIYFLIDVVLIYLIYPESIVKSLKTGFIWWVLAIVVGLVLGLIIGLVLSAIGIAMGTQPLLTWLTG
jgi:hypothetical protein